MSNPKPDRDRPAAESTPYGPHPHGVDEASGRADSSPFENLPSGEKGPAAERETEAGRRDPTSQPGHDRAP